MEECELVDWSRTRETLDTLISLFACKKCGNTLQDPCSFQICDHYFCKTCAMNLINSGTNCPGCDAVLWREHLQPNLRISEAMKISEQIRSLICNDEQIKKEVQNIRDDNTDIEIEDDSENIAAGSIKNIKCRNTIAKSLSEITPTDKKTEEVGINANSNNYKYLELKSSSMDNDDENIEYGGCGGGLIDLAKELHSNQADSVDKIGVDFNVAIGKAIHTHGDDFQSNKHKCPQDILTSIKSKSNLLAQKEDYQSSPSPEKSQFSEAVSDEQFAEGVQRNPKSSTKKPKFTYSRRKKGGSNEHIPKHNTTIPLLVTSRTSLSTEKQSSTESVFDFSSGTITKPISFENKNDKTNEEDTDMKASEKSIGSKRKRGEPTKSKSPFRKTDVGKDKNSPDTNTNENNENDKENKGSGQGKVQKPKARNLEKRNKKGETALHTACIKGNYDRAKELLQLGAQPNTKDFNGWTPLHEASNHGFTNIVELLLDYNAIIDCVAGEDNDTPLHDAVTNNCVGVTRLLLQRGAPTNIKNRLGILPNGYAYTNDMKNVFKEINMFDTHEISVNQLNTSSTTKDEAYVFITTNLKTSERVEVMKCCELLGGKLLSEFDSSVTHIICGVDGNGILVSRTMKYLLGILTGKWMVSFEWINESLKQRKWTLESTYEVKGSSDASVEIPHKSRINKFKSLPTLFEGCSFYLSGIFNTSLSKETLTNLIKFGGGKILYREPKTSNIDPLIVPSSHEIKKLKLGTKVTAPDIIYHAKENSPQICCKEYIIYDTGENPIHKKICSPILCTAPVAWLLDCISNFQILDVQDDYDQKEGYKSSQN